MEQLKAKFKEKCTWKNHSQVRRMLANIDLNDPDVISFLLGRGCLKCINLFLAAKKFQDGILLYIVRQPEIPLNVVKGFLEGNPKLFTDDVELPVQELTNCNRLDLLKLFRQMKREEISLEPPAKRARVCIYTSREFLKAYLRRDFEIIRMMLEKKYDARDSECSYFWDTMIEELSHSTFVKICQNEAGIWPKDVIMLLLSRIRAFKSALLEYAIKYENDDVLQAVIEQFPQACNYMFIFKFQKDRYRYSYNVAFLAKFLGKIEETRGTVLHYLAKNKKFDLLEEILHIYEKSGDIIDFQTLKSLCDALRAGAPLKTIKAFLKVRPDLIQELNKKEDIFLLHSAMGGEQPEVLRFLVKENRLNPQERNAEGLDPILYKISKYGHISSYQGLPKVSTEAMEMLEYLFPLIYGTNSIYNRKFGDLFDVYWFSTILERPNLFNACTETFYGPKVNSMYPLLKQVLQEFDLEHMVNPGQCYLPKNGRHICAFIHNPWNFPLKKHPYHLKYFMRPASILHIVLHMKAFDSDGKLEAYISLLKHSKTIGLFLERLDLSKKFGFIDFHLPFCKFRHLEPTTEIVSRLYRVLDKLRGKIHLNLSRMLRMMVHSIDDSKMYNKCGLFRALYSHYPVSRSEWQDIMTDRTGFIVSDRKNPENREFFSQLDELMPVDCLLKHMVSEDTLSLKHLCRLKIREVLEKKANGDSVKFFDSIDALKGIPPKMKKYLHFAEHIRNLSDLEIPQNHSNENLTEVENSSKTEQLKAKFKGKCKWKNHSQARRMLANSDVNDPDVISFLLGRGCLKCINLFLAVKKFQDGILLYIVRHPEIPLSVVKGFLEGNPDLFTDDVELPVQELTNSNRLDLLKLFRQMKGEEISFEPPAKKARLCMHTSEDFLKAFSGHDYEMLRFFLDPNNGWDKDVVLEEFVTPMIEKIYQEKARIWPKDIVMQLLSRMRRSKIEETRGTILHYLAKIKKFDLLDEFLDAYNFDKYPDTLISICDALSSGAPLKTIKAFLKVRPDLIQELNAKEDIFLLHSAMDGEQPEVLRFLVKENRLNPQERNAEGLDPILYKISKYGQYSWCRDLAQVSTEAMEMLEYLFPLIYDTNSFYNRKFGDLFVVYWFSGILERPNLFNACTETFYGPEVNSMYPLLKQVLQEFDLEHMVNPKRYYAANNGRQICAFIHNPWNFPLKKHPFRREHFRAEMKAAFCLHYEQHTKAFDSDGKLEAFISLLKHSETIGLVKQHWELKMKFGFLELYLPMDSHLEPTPEIVSRFYRVLAKLRGKIHFDLSWMLNKILQSAELSETYNKCGLIRALYSHFPVPSSEWQDIMTDHVECITKRQDESLSVSDLVTDRENVKNREVFSQLDELMPVDCLLKHMVSEDTLSLKHLCRLKIREVLEKKVDGDSVKFFDSIDALKGIPPKMKKYLHFAENFVEM